LAHGENIPDPKFTKKQNSHCHFNPAVCSVKHLLRKNENFSEKKDKKHQKYKTGKLRRGSRETIRRETEPFGAGFPEIPIPLANITRRDGLEYSDMVCLRAHSPLSCPAIQAVRPFGERVYGNF